MSRDLTASEAIYGFCAWLTTRKEKTVMSSSSNASPIAERIKEFCDENDLEDPRDNYTDYFSMPKKHYGGGLRLKP